MYENTEFTLSRDCEAILIPSGQKTTIPAGTQGVITQSLGGSYTIATYQGLARIAEKDLDAWVLKNPRRNQLKGLYAQQTARSQMKTSGISFGSATTRKSRSILLILVWFTIAV